MRFINTKRRSRFKHKSLVVVLITIISLMIVSPFVFFGADGQGFLKENSVEAFNFSVELDKIASKTGFNLATGGREFSSLPYIIGNIIYSVLALIGVVFLIIAIIAGYRWMWSGGNEETISKARQSLSRAMIGIIIILTAYAITSYVIKALLGG